MASIFSKLGSAIRSSMHDALDKAETPDSVINRLLRESTDNITRARTLAIEAVASEKRLADEIGKREILLTKWAEAAATAIAGGDEEAARSALNEKIEMESLLQILKPQHEKAVANSDVLKVRLKELEQSLAALKSRKSAIQARQKGAEALREADEVANTLLSQNNLNEEVLRVEDMLSDLEARNEAMAEIQSFTQPHIDIDAQRKADQIERELAVLRNNK